MKRRRKRGGFFLLNPLRHVVKPFVKNSLKQKMTLLRERKGMGQRRHRHGTNAARRHGGFFKYTPGIIMLNVIIHTLPKTVISRGKHVYIFHTSQFSFPIIRHLRLHINLRFFTYASSAWREEPDAVDY